MKQFIAGENENGVRLSRFVQNVTHNMPTSVLYKSFRNKRIKVNRKRADADFRLSTGDIIELYINDEFFQNQQSTNATSKKPKKADKLKVLFEDNNIAALYKPVHLLCHSDCTGDNSLVDIFKEYLKQNQEYDESAEHTFSPSICNRLDRGTEGIVIAAKNYSALRDMNAIIRDDCLQKQYLCVTFGIPKQGIHFAYLKHAEKNNKVTVQKYMADGFKEIKTGVTILEQKGPFCLCKIDLYTGRTHQIRAHLAFLNAPILGDIKYGNRKMNQRTNTNTQLLCAHCVTFGEIPKENTLSYLSQKQILLENTSVESKFKQL